MKQSTGRIRYAGVLVVLVALAAWPQQPAARAAFGPHPTAQQIMARGERAAERLGSYHFVELTRYPVIEYIAGQKTRLVEMSHISGSYTRAFPGRTHALETTGCLSSCLGGNKHSHSQLREVGAVFASKRETDPWQCRTDQTGATERFDPFSIAGLDNNYQVSVVGVARFEGVAAWRVRIFHVDKHPGGQTGYHFRTVIHLWISQKDYRLLHIRDVRTSHIFAGPGRPDQFIRVINWVTISHYGTATGHIHLPKACRPHAHA